MELPADLYFNRELSWLRFNTRVLDQVCDESLPLLERLKFLAIYGTNLDEFYMIRVAGLKHLYDHSVVQEGLQMGHGKQLECIRSYLVAEQKIVQEQFLQLKEKLAQQHLVIKSVEELSTKNTEKLRAYFDNYLYPVVVPIDDQ